MPPAPPAPVAPHGAGQAWTHTTSAVASAASRVSSTAQAGQLDADVQPLAAMHTAAASQVPAGQRSRSSGLRQSHTHRGHIEAPGGAQAVVVPPAPAGGIPPAPSGGAPPVAPGGASARASLAPPAVAATPPAPAAGPPPSDGRPVRSSIPSTCAQAATTIREATAVEDLGVTGVAS